MSERWEDIPDFEGIYEISDQGKIWSIYRKTKVGLRGGQEVKTRICRYTSGTGFLGVSLNKDGKAKVRPVRMLVAEAFIPNPNCRKHVGHLNGDITDCRAENLYWKGDMSYVRTRTALRTDKRT